MDLAVYVTLQEHALRHSATQANTITGANVSETTNGTRTKWPTSGGSVMINGSHEFAFTYVNLGLGRNVTNFNISLVDNFNQTGAGALCLKDAVKESLKAGLKKSNISEESLEGMDASLQVIQIGHSGSSLYNVSLRNSERNDERETRANDQTVHGHHLQQGRKAAR